MSVYGTENAPTARAAATRLASIHLGIATASIVIPTPGNALAITGRGETLAQIGSVLALASMAIFAFVVLRHGVGAQATGLLRGREPSTQTADPT